MEEKGFAAVSVQHLADALEFSKANFYHHVESKEQLLHEIFVEILQYSLSHVETIVNADASYQQRLADLVAFYMSLMTERRAVMLVWFKERAHLQGKHDEEVGKLEQGLGIALDRFYANGSKAGAFKKMDPEAMRHAVFGACFMFTKHKHHLERPAIAKLTRQLQDFVSAGLLR